MSPRRRTWVPPGLLVVAKPPGPTSHDLVDYVRRLLPRKAKVGHAGTLDPFAEGVLPILVGGATRLADRVGAGEKRYLAEGRLDADTDTDDATGAEVARYLCPEDLGPETVGAAVRALTGEIQQRPPAYSAVRVAGRRAYELAREGRPPELEARSVTVHDFEVLELEWPRIRFRVRCGRGTYIRVLARDLGHALGAGGHLTGLVREAVGPLELVDAYTPFELIQLPALRDGFVPLERVLNGSGRGRVAGSTLDRVLCGNSVQAADILVEEPGETGEFVLYPEDSPDPIAVAITEVTGRVRPVRVFAPD